jgi:cell division protein FtsI/penicillin-binding protein 2
MSNEPNIDNEEIPPQEPKRKLWKFLLVFLVLNLAFLAIIVRLFIVQIADAEKYKQQAKRQHEAKVTLRAERGNIYDRNGKLLASTVTGVSLAADPTVMDEKEKLCMNLESVTGIAARELLNKINSSDGSFVWLARGLIPGNLAGIDSIKIKGFIKFTEPLRNYLYAPSASQIIGCTDIDNKGLTGIELSLDSVLGGKSGYMIMQRDATGHIHPTANLPVIEALHGKSVILTIDIELQRILEYELQKGMESTKAAGGTAIAIMPSSGEILAMVSFPGFDPNDLKNVQPGTMRCRALTDLYEPGSTFKLITASAAIDKGLYTPDKLVNGHGGVLDFGKYKITDDHGIGIVTFADALAYSSNVVFSQVGYSIPDSDFYKYIRGFGFGSKLGLEIPGEVAGKIRTPEEFTPIAKRFMSFGYGIAVTPLQMLTAYSTVADKGVFIKPHIIKAIIDNNGDTTIYQIEKLRRVISEKSAQTITDMLVGVVEKGTGKAAKIEGYSVAGKTGTSQKLVNGSYSTQSYMASFIGYFPADNPKIAVLVLLDSPQGAYYGGATAAPIFRNIIMDWLAITPTEQKFTTKTDKMPPKLDSVYVPDIRGLYVRDAVPILQNFRLKYNINGDSNDIIASQIPSPGNRMPAWKKVEISTKNYMTKGFKPDVRGFALRRALIILHNAGIKTKVSGSGKVRDQQWSTEGKSCTLICN